MKIMNNLSRYIIEKLKLNKDTTIEKENKYIESIFKVISTDINSTPKLKEKILNWLGNYNKTLYCYTTHFYFDYENIYFKKKELYEKVSVTSVSFKQTILNVFNQIKEKNNKWSGEGRIHEIYYDDFNLGIILKDYPKNEPILIEKVKI